MLKMTPEKLAIAFKSACMAELEALKPGNVHLFADGHGMTITDFIKSADATALVIAQPNLSVGERILHAVQATQNAVGLNTNLGIILLCAPLIHAALQVKVDSIDINQALLEQLQYTLHSSCLLYTSFLSVPLRAFIDKACRAAFFARIDSSRCQSQNNLAFGG